MRDGKTRRDAFNKTTALMEGSDVGARMAANIPDNPSSIRLSLLMIAKVMREPSGERMLFHRVHLLSPLYTHTCTQRNTTLHLPDPYPFLYTIHRLSLVSSPYFVLFSNNLTQISILESSIAYFLKFVRYFTGMVDRVN